MATLSDTRMTVLEIINEVRRKLGINVAATSLTYDNQTRTLLDYLNDVISEVSDYGDWKEMILQTVVTASSSVRRYQLNVTAAVKNIHEIAWTTQPSAMRLVTINDMLRWERITSTGQPRNWAIMGVDVSSANPLFEVYPMPGPTENNQTFSILYYQKPSLLTTADVSAYPAFPGKLLVSGLLAKALFDENRNASDTDYLTERANFENMLSETFNRFNGDSGTNTFFTPGQGGFRRV